MSSEETELAYNKTATHGSRSVLRDCMSEAGQIDLDLPHAPLLFVLGVEDQIIPYELNERQFRSFYN